jgi:hypothetical protein
VRVEDGRAVTEPRARIGRPAEGGSLRQRVVAVVDDELRELPEGAVILFSGGVDSGLLAARAAALGRRDVRLAHMSFGADDPDTAAARAMARELGLELDVHDFDLAHAGRLLAVAGLEYAYPFSDPSVVPTHQLAELVAGAPAVVDGTGADGLFAVWTRVAPFERVYRIPRAVRAAASAAYARSGIWLRDNRAERALRVMRRTVQLPLMLPAAITALNALEGIAYRAPAAMAPHWVGVAQIKAVDAIADPELPLDKWASLFDMVHVCAGEYASKTWSPLTARGSKPVYPFLTERMLEAVYGAEWSHEAIDPPKRALIEELEEVLPYELVHRRKHAFLPPHLSMLGSPGVQEHARKQVLDGGGPLAGLLEPEPNRRLWARAAAGAPLPIGAYNFMWASLFLACWLRPAP